jgi:hypothetical protein
LVCFFFSCDGSDDSEIFKLNRPNHRSLSFYEVDLYADYPAEPSHSIEFTVFVFLLLFGSVFLDLKLLCVGGGCYDEDNKLPLLKALRTLAGRIEPINTATTE